MCAKLTSPPMIAGAGGTGVAVEKSKAKVRARKQAKPAPTEFDRLVESAFYTLNNRFTEKMVIYPNRTPNAIHHWHAEYELHHFPDGALLKVISY